MTKHPLFALADAELDAVLEAGDAPPSLRSRVRGVRAGEVPLEGLQGILAEFHAILHRPDGFRWPWVALDSQLGLLPMGELAVVLGQTGQGKTTFTSSLLNRLPPTCPALVFATEIPADRYLTALAARRAGLHPDLVIHGEWGRAGKLMDASQARQAYTKALGELESAPLSIAPQLSLKASEMLAHLTKAVETAKQTPQLVIVDHFQAIDHDLAWGYKGQQETLRLLHQFAHDQYLTLIVTNQASLKGGEGPRRSTDCLDLAGSFGGQTLAQFAAQVVGLHRVFVEQTATGLAVTPQFLTEYRRAGGKEQLLWDRERVAVDLLKVRYDAYGATGSEVRLRYRNGQYWDAE